MYCWLDTSHYDCVHSLWSLARAQQKIQIDLWLSGEYYFHYVKGIGGQEQMSKVKFIKKFTTGHIAMPCENISHNTQWLKTCDQSIWKQQPMTNSKNNLLVWLIGVFKLTIYKSLNFKPACGDKCSHKVPLYLSKQFRHLQKTYIYALT